jgi:hypothetical protein
MKKRTTKVVIAGLLVVVGLMSVVGFSYATLTNIDHPSSNTISLGGEKMADKELDFTVMYPGNETSDLPPQVKQWFDEHKNQEFTGTMQDQNAVYAVVTRGEKPNGGYGVEVVGVTERAGDIVIKVRYKNPEPGKMYTQVITYPAALVKIPLTDKPIHFETVNEKSRIPFS